MARLDRNTPPASAPASVPPAVPPAAPPTVPPVVPPAAPAAELPQPIPEQPPVAPVPPAPPAPPVALNPFTPGVLVRLRKMAADELAKAERDVRSGPGGMGWAHNESKRTECEEWLVFCRFAAEELHRA